MIPCARFVPYVLAGLSSLSGCTRTPAGASRAAYPQHWWTPVASDLAAGWEILPQQAGPGEVIVSKRNELGLLSNFSETPFAFHGRRYPCLEAFWQMMKYPENDDDPRAQAAGVRWLYTRDQVARMDGFAAKAAGKLASDIMATMGINWVTFEGRRLTYRTPSKGAHYDLIVEAMRAKLSQNPEARDVLLATGDLILRPDHLQSPDAPPAWRYCEIYMELRAQLRKTGGLR